MGYTEQTVYTDYLTVKYSGDLIHTYKNKKGLDRTSSYLGPYSLRPVGQLVLEEELQMLRKITQTAVRLTAAFAGAAATMVACPTSGQTPVNTGFIDPATWIRGPLYDPPATHPIWNPAKIARMTAGTQWALGTQNGFTEWTQVWAMWNQPCAYAPVSAPGVQTPGAHVPGSRLSTLLRRDIQKALDGGAMNLVIPTMDSVEEAQDVIDLVYFPPIGHRTYGPGQWQTMYANVPGGYRQTFNDNINIVFMIETILGSQAAGAIGANGNVDGLFGATADLGNFSGYLSGDVDYEKLIRNSYDAAHSHGERACTAFGFQGRVSSAGFPAPYGSFAYQFDCYQN